MYKKINYLILVVSSFVFIYAGHKSGGTDYTESGAKTYATVRHGKDGALFLDPYFLPFFENIENLRVLDAGCGAGPWSIYAAQKGAEVFGIDIQENMIKQARSLAEKEVTMQPIHFQVGSVGALPYSDNFFDCAVSINVGCNLPQEVFIKHFQELYRTLKSGGKVVITAPANFATIFALEHDNVVGQMQHALAEINSQEELLQKIGSLNSILRATIVQQGDQFSLVHNENYLQEGQPIWRKIPGMVVPNFYHSEQSYNDALVHAGFTIIKIDRPMFETVEAWQSNQEGFNRAYYEGYPFVIFHVQK